MKVYLSLPISGQPTKERMDYANQVKREIECTYRCGWGYFKFEDELNIITPFDVCPEPDKPYSYYMGKDIEALLECDAIYLCEGWQNSKGCMAEFEVARMYGKEIIFEREW